MNNDRKLMKLVEHKKIFFCISLGIFLIGIICNIVFGTTLSINFTGGSIVKYSYTGTVDQQKIKMFCKTPQMILFPLQSAKT